jgi:Flp pilus assembly protein TadG
MAASKRRLNSRRERGSVIIEMAIVTPLLLFMMAGIVDLGLLYWEQEVLTNAAREGARAGARAKLAGAADKKVSEVRTIVENYLQANKIKNSSGGLITLSGSNCTYTYDTSTSPATLTVRLIDIPVKMMMLPNIQTLFDGTGVSSDVKLNARITMAAEWVTPPLP